MAECALSTKTMDSFQLNSSSNYQGSVIDSLLLFVLWSSLNSYEIPAETTQIHELHFYILVLHKSELTF